MIVAAHTEELHHRIPRYLLRLHDRAHGADLDGEGIELVLHYEHELTRYGVDVSISREDLTALVEASVVLIPAAEHRNGHSEATDFQRWGRRGGLRTLQLYGTAWFSALALKRWGRITRSDLDAMRVVR